MAKTIVAVITGDIISSQRKEASVWLPKLKAALKTTGNTPEDWEIYRGDSFQLQLPKEDVLEKAFYIKSVMKQIKDIDVRMAIGLGTKDHNAKKITESNGQAFVRSGTCFNDLKKTTLAISSGNEAFDEKINLMLSLTMLTSDNWKTVTSFWVNTALKHPDLNQEALAKKLKKAQSSVSEGLKRAGYEEILLLIDYYKKELATI